MVTESTEVTPTQLAGVRALGRPNSFASTFDFWDDRYEGRRLFSVMSVRDNLLMGAYLRMTAPT